MIVAPLALRRVRVPDESAPVQVITVGDVSFVAYPGEMFAETAEATRAASSTAHTFVLGLSNGYVGYVPTEAAFEHGGYEPTIGYHSRLRAGAAEHMTEATAQLAHTVAASH